MNFELRLAKISDVPRLQELIALSARVLQAAFYTREQIEGAIGTVFGVDTQLIRDETYFVVQSGETIVGCGGWSRRATLFGGDRAKIGEDPLLNPATDPARIRAFFVHPDCARQGIGRKLMDASESAAFAGGFRRIDIVATRAGEPLYLRFGYSVVERFEIPLPNGARMPAVRLTKSGFVRIISE